MDLALMHRLSGPEGARLLEAAEATYNGTNPLPASKRLRQHHDDALVSAALTQVALRRKAATKFGAAAARMFFTTEGLQQATHRRVAERRAARVARGDVRRLLDLGCGIGADLLAFAHQGISVVAVDRDALTAAVARANLAALGLDGVVTVADATTQPRDGFDAIFVDPARRNEAGRIFDPHAFSPSWHLVEEVMHGTAVVKTAPGIPHARVPADVEAEWVSLDGQLREAAMWSGPLAQCRRRATVLTSAGDEMTLTDADDPGPAPCRPVGRFVLEPDDAVVRAHLVTAVAARVDGWLLDPHLAYVSSDRPGSTPGLRSYEVVDVLPFREKQLRAALRARNIGALTIKKRGIAIAPEMLRARLRLRGERSATLILTRTPGSSIALLVDPRPSPHGTQQVGAVTPPPG